MTEYVSLNGIQWLYNVLASPLVYLCIAAGTVASASSVQLWKTALTLIGYTHRSATPIYVCEEPIVQPESGAGPHEGNVSSNEAPVLELWLKAL